MASNEYVPTGEELSNAIAKELKQFHGEVDAKHLQAALKKTNPTWQIPERRVHKFFKRHMMNHTDPEAADDDADAKTPGRVKRFMNFLSPHRGAKQEGKETAPEEAPEPEPMPEAPVEVEDKNEEPETTIEPRNLEQVYKDDNTGARNDCDCTGCAIM